MQLSTKQIKHLRALAHNIKPVVMIGQNGLSDNIHMEIDVIDIKASAREMFTLFSLPPSNPKMHTDPCTTHLVTAVDNETF